MAAIFTKKILRIANNYVFIYIIKAFLDHVNIRNTIIHLNELEINILKIYLLVVAKLFLHNTNRKKITVTSPIHLPQFTCLLILYLVSPHTHTHKKNSYLLYSGTCKARYWKGKKFTLIYTIVANWYQALLIFKGSFI